MDVAFPYAVDARGRTAGASESEHVRDLVEQVLFTAPGQRVNRPTFGSGLLDLVFEPGGDAVAAATEHAVQGALQLWLGDRIVVEAVDVAAGDGELAVTVSYVLRSTLAGETATFSRSRP